MTPHEIKSFFTSELQDILKEIEGAKEPSESKDKWECFNDGLRKATDIIKKRLGE